MEKTSITHSAVIPQYRKFQVLKVARPVGHDLDCALCQIVLILIPIKPHFAYYILLYR